MAVTTAAVVTAGAAVSGAMSARKAGKAQERSARDSIAFQKESRDIARADLEPFKAFGESQINPLKDLLDNKGDSIRGNETFQVASEVLSDDIAGRNAARGKLGSGETLNDLFRENALLGESLFNSDFNRRFNALNLGQASAAGQANTAVTTGANVGETLLQKGNAEAAGKVGQANAISSGVNNLISLAGTAGLFNKAPAPTTTTGT
jgi:hypothetical protein